MVRLLELPVNGRRGYVGSIGLSKSGDEFQLEWEGTSMTMTKGSLERKQVELAEWLSARPGETLTAADLDRLGFCDGSSSPVDGSSSSQYEILRVALGSGKESGWKAGRYYTSDKLHGGPETFWEVVFHSIETHIVSIDDEPGSPICSDMEFCKDANALRPSVELFYSAVRRATFMNALDKWCREHPGRFFKISSPGNRGTSSSARSFLFHDEPVFCFAPNGECVRAALPNALCAVADAGVAKTMLMKGSLAHTRLGPVGSWLERTMKKYFVKNVLVPPNVDDESWIMGQDEGIFLGSIHGLDSTSEEVEHTLAIDATRKLVFDPCEKLAMRPRPGVFDSCVGDGFEFIDFVGLKKVMVYKVGSGKHKNRKVLECVKRLRRQGDGKKGERGWEGKKHRRSKKMGNISDED